MLCCICKEKEATVHLTQIAGDKMQKVDLCEECAGLKCPACGFTQSDFKKAGRLGCPECYETFAEPLKGLLKTMHKGTRHVGKMPEALRHGRDLSDRLKNLQKRLSQAIEAEDFEEAAILRDEIKQATARATNPTAG
jgi:protein arginine kinase activator